MNRFTFLTLAVSALALQACAPALVAGGAAVGVASVQEGGLSQAGQDAWIQTQINDLWFKHDFMMFQKLDLTIDQGRVLITGVVQDPQHRVEAVRLAWQPAGVKQVINEIKVADSEGFVGYAKDAWITTRLRSAILLDSEITSINYSIDTVQGTVYLMGFAQNQAELDRVISKARTISNVRNVVSYVKMVGSAPITREQPPAAGAYGATTPSKVPYKGNADLWGEGNTQAAPSGDGFGTSVYDNGNASGATVAPVADGEPIDWNSGADSYR